jgi:hypothetical protein
MPRVEALYKGRRDAILTAADKATSDSSEISSFSVQKSAITDFVSALVL